MNTYRKPGEQSETLNDDLNRAYQEGRAETTGDVAEIAQAWLIRLTERALRDPVGLTRGTIGVNSVVDAAYCSDWVDEHFKEVIEEINALLKVQAPDFRCVHRHQTAYLERRED
jgi:hypothetical protein